MAAVRKGEPAVVDWLQQELAANNVERDRVLLNAILAHYAARDIDQAWAVLQEMLSRGFALPARAFNDVLLSDRITNDRADAVWAAMVASGTAPNLHTYLGRLRAALRGRAPAKVRQRAARPNPRAAWLRLYSTCARADVGGHEHTSCAAWLGHPSSLELSRRRWRCGPRCGGPALPRGRSITTCC